MRRDIQRELEMDARIKQLLAERDGLGRIIADLQTQKQVIETETRRLEGANTKLWSHIQIMTEEITDYKEQVNVYKNEILGLEEKITAHTAQLDGISVDITEKTAALQGIVKEIDAIKNNWIREQEQHDDEVLFMTRQRDQLRAEWDNVQKSIKDAQNILIEERNALEKREQVLAEREARIQEQIDFLDARLKDTEVLRKRLKQLAEDNNIHFSIAI